MPPIPKPIAFRIYPEGRSLYCRVNIWPTKAAMHAYYRSTRGKERADAVADGDGLATGREVYRIEDDGRRRKVGEFCEINCNLQSLGAEIVAHEAAHAALRWAERRRIDPTTRGDGFDVSGDEERFCYAVGRMIAQFNDQCHRREVWAKVEALHARRPDHRRRARHDLGQ